MSVSEHRGVRPHCDDEIGDQPEAGDSDERMTCLFNEIGSIRSDRLVTSVSDRLYVLPDTPDRIAASEDEGDAQADQDERCTKHDDIPSGLGV